MSRNSSERKSYYDRVMPRVHSKPNPNIKSTSNVIRHEKPSSLRNGAKPSSSKLNTGVYKELPLVLNDYEPELPPGKPKVVKSSPKPKKTFKSLDPAKSPVLIKKTLPKKVNSIANNRNSVPSLLVPNSGSWSDAHMRQCFSSRSHTRLKELKDEIKQFEETQKLMQMRSKLYKKCGVVLNDVGQVAEDKAVQVEELNNSMGNILSRTLETLRLRHD